MHVSAFAFALLVNMNKDFQFLFILNKALQDKASLLIPLHEWSQRKTNNAMHIYVILRCTQEFSYCLYRVIYETHMVLQVPADYIGDTG